MRKTKLLILAFFLANTSLSAMSAKIKKPTKVLEGTSSGQHAKLGAPVSISHTISSADINEILNADITFITHVQKRSKIKIKIIADKNLNIVHKKNNYLLFADKNKNQNSIHLKLSSAVEGEHFINVMVDMGRKGMRAFSVPVVIGNRKKISVKNTNNTKGSSGENISISEGKETIY